MMLGNQDSRAHVDLEILGMVSSNGLCSPPVSSNCWAFQEGMDGARMSK